MVVLLLATAGSDAVSINVDFDGAVADVSSSIDDEDVALLSFSGNLKF